MASPQEKVVIQEPPIQELNKKRSCVKRTCVTGCGCIAAFIVATVVFLHLITGPRTTTLHNLPDTVDNTVPVYDLEAVDKITHIPGAESHKFLELMAYVPKVILAPIALSINTTVNETIPESEASRWQQFVSFLQEPIADHRDTYILWWDALAAKPTFIFQHYVFELQNQGYEVDVHKQTDKYMYLTFSKDTVDGNLVITDNPQENGTDMIKLTVHIPN